MIIKPVLIVVFWFLAIWGAFEMVRGTRKMRAPRKYKDAVLAWSERPLPSFKYDPTAWLAISIHGMSVVVIGSIVLINLIARPFNPVASSFLMMLILVFMIAIVGQIWGSIIFYPLALSLAGDRHHALSTEGMLWAGKFIPWSAFSGFSFDCEKNIIRLWSASLPGTIAFMFVPPQELLSDVIDTLRSHLPRENWSSPPRVAEQYLLPIAMIVGCIPVVTAAFFLSQLPLEIALIGNSILIYLLTILGGPVMLRSLLGKDIRPAAIE